MELGSPSSGNAFTVGASKIAGSESPSLPTQSSERPSGIELQLGEAFHRIKRTVMVLAGALVLLGCTDPEIVRRTMDAIPAIDGVVHASTITLRAGLLMALLYYTWGFWHEVTAAERSNRDLLNEGALSGYETDLRAFVEKTQAQSKQLDAVVSSIEPRLTAALGTWQPVLDNLETGEATSRSRAEWGFDDSNPGWRHRATPEQASQMEIKRTERIEDARTRFYEEQGAVLSQSLERLRSIKEDWAPTVNLIRDLAFLAEKAAQRVTLNRSIYRDRRIGFYWWEVNSTYIAAFFAVLFTITPLGFKGADLLARLVVKFSW